jgi:hypothetical protein
MYQLTLYGTRSACSTRRDADVHRIVSARAGLQRSLDMLPRWKLARSLE